MDLTGGEQEAREPRDATQAAPTRVGQGQPRGLIDIHCHLLPGIDDGCETYDESFACIRRLRAAGFVGSICTPHVWPELFPENTPANIDAWTRELRERLAEAGLRYDLWSGGELRMFRGVVDWLEEQGVPTLGPSRCVLVDFWEDRWPKWVTPAFQWLLDQGYQPVLAHPERMRKTRDLLDRLADVQAMGVWLQGNARCMTGEEGFDADRLVRELLAEGRYRFFALDLHRPDGIEGRLDGLSLVEAEFGEQTIEQLLVDAPRRDILAAAS